MLLHKDKELFREVIFSTAADLELPIPIVEKDYYVTMILKKLSEAAPECVFKGGTSLSKCHHAIERFSEDIDIAFSNRLTQGERKKLKDGTIVGISKELELPIMDWEMARSRRNYNCYTFAYEPLEGFVPESLIHGVKMEVVLSSLAFPTVKLPVDSYVYQFLCKENRNIVEEYGLEPFTMTIQSMERTLADKVFALCDYYLKGEMKRNSRHIYDIYMLLPKVTLDEGYKRLVHEIRMQRAEAGVSPVAGKGNNIPRLLKKIIDEEVYREDYRTITAYFQNHPIEYDVVITAIKQIAESGLFEDEEFDG
jgi:hypothetical protein